MDIIGKRAHDILENLEEKSNYIVYLLIGIVLIGGVAYSIILNDAVRFPDEQDYLNIANNLLKEGHYSINGEVPTAHRPPGYPLIIYILMRCGATLFTLRLFNFLSFAFSLIIIFKLLAKNENKLAGLVAVLLCSLYPLYFYTAGTILSQTIGLALFVTVIYLVSREKSSLSSFFAGGFLYGCLVLTVPLFILNLPIVSLAPLLLKTEEWQKKIAIFLISSIFVMGVWTVRNYIMLDHFVPLTTNSGLNFLLGNHEKAHPTSYIEVFNFISDQYQDKIKNYNEVERDNFYRNKAWEWVKNNKVAALELYLLKVVNYFNYRDTLATSKEASRLKEIIMFICYVPLLIILCIRLLLVKYYNLSRFEIYFIFLYLSNAFLMAIFHIRIRWRMPYDVLLICVVAIFIARVMMRKFSFNNKYDPNTNTSLTE